MDVKQLMYMWTFPRYLPTSSNWCTCERCRAIYLRQAIDVHVNVVASFTYVKQLTYMWTFSRAIYLRQAIHVHVNVVALFTYVKQLTYMWTFSRCLPTSSNSCTCERFRAIYLRQAVDVHVNVFALSTYVKQWTYMWIVSRCLPKVPSADSFFYLLAGLASEVEPALRGGLFVACNASVLMKALSRS